MSEGYGALRLWSTVLVIVGVAGVIFVVIGTIFAIFAAPSFWQCVAFLFIGGLRSQGCFAFSKIHTMKGLLSSKYSLRP